ncbi:hypothetical protein PM082_009829 [Marasmius tenuissimus]|nr:hypothetical protein PM082_009829 [Marasmius tenuissimus]
MKNVAKRRRFEVESPARDHPLPVGRMWTSTSEDVSPSSRMKGLTASYSVPGRSTA